MHFMRLHHLFCIIISETIAVKSFLVQMFYEFLIFYLEFLALKIGKKASLSEVKRAQIVILHKVRLSERLISEKVECSKTAVHQAIVKFKICGSYVDKNYPT